MSDNTKTVKMSLVEPGQTGPDGEFQVAFQPRFNPSRTVVFDLTAQDAEHLHKALTAYLKVARKTKE